MPGIYVALGSNLGDRMANLRRALALLPPDVRVASVSPVYVTAPQPPAPPPPFFNAVCRVETSLEPEPLLDRLKAVEAQMGRRASGFWAPRVIDLDLILYNDEVVRTPRLTVPHPRLTERLFVLVPLLDLDYSLLHPETGEALADVLAKVSDSLTITAVGEV